MKHIVKAFFTATMIAIAFAMNINPATITALTEDQRTLYNRNILYYDLELCGPSEDASAVEAGQGSPTGTLFPDLNPDSMADAIDRYIQRESSGSKMKNLGQTIVAGAENSNINPFLIVAIAQKESNLADPNAGDGFNVRNANNAFGRTATASQPHVQGQDRLWYKWSSVKASVDHTAPENKGANGGGDIAAYLREQYGGALDKGDLNSFMNEYAPDFENDTSAYIEEVEGWVTEMAGMTRGGGGGNSGGNPADNSATPQVQAKLNGKKAYIVGDSIDDAARNALKREFREKGAEAYINATPGSSITYPAGGMSGLQAVEHDKNRIKDSDIIIIAHATNHFPSDLEAGMRQIVRKVKSYNGSATLFWVNTFASSSGGNPAYTKEGTKKKNKIIDRLSSSLNYTVIDVKSANIGTYDGIHPDIPEGNNKYAKTVADGISENTEIEASGQTECCTTTVFLDGSGSAENIYNFLAGEMGLTNVQAAGIMGNIRQESNFDPNALNPSSGAYGIVQWYAGRRTALENFASEKGVDKSDLAMQLQFLKKELEGTYRESVLNPIKNSNNLTEVVRIWLEKFEIPCTPGPACDPEMNIRMPFAEEWVGRSDGASTSASGSSGGCGNGSGESSGSFIWPDDGRKDPLTSCFGQRWGRLHGGIDIGSSEGQTVTASDGGTVEIAGDVSGFGNTVVIKHDNGFWTLYAHNTSLNVNVGDKVDQGQVVAKVGGTGGDYAPHIHFNVQTAGGADYNNSVDPLKHLPRDGRSSSGTNCPSGSF